MRIRVVVAVALAALALSACAGTPALPPDGGPDDSACDATQLGFDLEQRPKDYAGLAAYDIALTNEADAACTLEGYPLVEVLAVDGSTLGQSPVPTSAAAAVSLEPGESAYLLVELTRGTVDCDSANTGGIRITLPGDDEPIVITEPEVLFCAAPDGDAIRASAFSAEPLLGHELRPDPENR